jgi:hypothetical protein
MKNFSIVLALLLAMLAAGCAAPMANRSNDPQQRRPSAGLFGTMGQQDQNSNRPPDAGPSDTQENRK